MLNSDKWYGNKTAITMMQEVNGLCMFKNDPIYLCVNVYHHENIEVILP